ncbi:MAG: long-chain fatty acid--CoA ligase [Pseudomonadota bacterium]
MSTHPPYKDLVRHHAAGRPDRVAIRNLSSGRALTYAQLDRRADRLARHLQDAGVARGDRVAILAYNGAEFFELQYACSRIGAVAVLLNWRLSVPELEYIVRDCTPLLLLHDVAFQDAATRLEQVAGLRSLLAIDAGDPNSSYERALAAAEAPPAWADVTHDDLCLLMYTSGTTGHPKGALITHGMVWWNTVNVTFACHISSDAVQLVILPLFHIGGLNSHANPILHAGGTIVLHRSFEPGEALRAIGDAALGITHLTGVPAQYQFMAAHPRFAETDLRRLQFVGVGGSPIAMVTIEAWTGRGVPMAQGFGMTESCPGALSLDTADILRKPGSIGRPLPYTDVRVVADDGRSASPGEVGELWLRGPNIAPGYWKNPPGSGGAFVDGWFRTGDAARMDDEGFFYIVDRVKDMYISGGENVYPAEVENVLYQFAQVGEAAVIGVPHARWGETGLAIVAPRAGAEIDAQQLIAHCAARLAKFKVPAEIVVVDALPRTAAGKVLKRELRQRYKAAPRET